MKAYSKYFQYVAYAVGVAIVAIIYQNCGPSSVTPAASTSGTNGAQSVCPINYIFVPSNANFSTSDFCVAKYEAKNLANLPESQPTGLPWVSITRDQAKAACVAKGTNYHLLDNNHWMTVARNIESVSWNFGGDLSIQEYGLSRGVTNNTGTTGVEASADDNDSCHLALESNGSPAVCDLNTYDVARRVHKLTNGDLIWDFAGNVSEWISDDYSQNFGVNDWVINLTDLNIIRTFGPSGSYPAGPAHPTGNIFMYNLGYFSSNVPVPAVVLRGGGFNYGRYAGVYTAYFAPTTQSAPDTGFRCYYQP